MSNTARTFRLPVELWAAVDEAAAELGQSKTVFVRRALVRALDEALERAVDGALEEALGGSRVGAPGRGAGDLDAGALPKGPLFGPDAPAPPPRAPVAKTYGAPDPRPVVVEPGRGKRVGGFVPRPKKGS